MKLYQSNIFLQLLAFLIMPALGSCTSKAICVAEPQKTGAAIVALSGPEHIQAGTQATITVAVRNERHLCVKEANAAFTNIGLDTLLVNAELSYLPEPGDECDCRRDSIIYTLLYFKPLNNGVYRFITAPLSSVAEPAAIVNLDIVVY